ncbi:coiled-coil domain-containing protein [Mycoplasmopsis opalescens]|uniref:hypothetical protein n=1 Tax=Mycoplasmopsis opalescens TaxID=114886 RepID=UPI0004A6AD90|nr:hypothetical protein [Mycoplasmopsis opalescens]
MKNRNIKLLLGVGSMLTLPVASVSCANNSKIQEDQNNKKTEQINQLRKENETVKDKNNELANKITILEEQIKANNTNTETLNTKHLESLKSLAQALPYKIEKTKFIIKAKKAEKESLTGDLAEAKNNLSKFMAPEEGDKDQITFDIEAYKQELAEWLEVIEFVTKQKEVQKEISVDDYEAAKSTKEELEENIAEYEKIKKEYDELVPAGATNESLNEALIKATEEINKFIATENNEAPFDINNSKEELKEIEKNLAEAQKELQELEAKENATSDEEIKKQIADEIADVKIVIEALELDKADVENEIKEYEKLQSDLDKAQKAVIIKPIYDQWMNIGQEYDKDRDEYNVEQIKEELAEATKIYEVGKEYVEGAYDDPDGVLEVAKQTKEELEMLIQEYDKLNDAIKKVEQEIEKVEAEIKKAETELANDESLLNKINIELENNKQQKTA